LAEQALALGKTHQFKVEVLEHDALKKLGMGSFLGVAQGSEEPPKFIIMQHLKGKKEQKPVVLVGKGITFDTGGISLKPGSDMDEMKYDMCGAASVIGTFKAIAAMNLPLNVIGVIPTCENMPDGRATRPGDVLTSMSGLTIEVLNTDAEGRMILADALTQAKKYTPEVVVDLATLTGAAVVAVGHIGIAMMSTASDAVVDKMKQAGDHVHERVVQFPLWDEYDELLKSDIADQKNIGGPYGGSITAAKFLQAFTDYPWIHLDIAGPAFLPQPDHYRSKNGTGVGVRLLVDFLKQF
jgi:leucyl aminopeptidase